MVTGILEEDIFLDMFGFISNSPHTFQKPIVFIKHAKNYVNLVVRCVSFPRLSILIDSLKLLFASLI